VNKSLYNYLEKEWRINNHSKYQHYFQLWVENLTDNQIEYFNKFKDNKK